MAMRPAIPADIQVRANLAAAIFPFQTDLQGRTIIVAGADENYNYLDQIGEPVKDRGIPQASYMHNVLPTSEGYQAVGYESQITSVDTLGDFDTVFELQYATANGVILVLFSPAGGANYIFDAAVGSWVSFPVVGSPITSQTQVTCALAQGVTYICFAGIGIYQYTPGSSPTFTATSITGITASSIQAICGSYGYLVAIDYNNNVYWSNVVNPTDFVPSLITGAGGGTISAARGTANFVAPIAGGFIVYCQLNAVGATYTGNINFPFAFFEVAGSGGAVNNEDVTVTSNAASHYAWTSAGIQNITLASATNVFPQATEFLEKKIFEDFSEVTNLLTTTFLITPLYTKLSLVADRWVVISYGQVQDVFTHALVFDITLQRWGKLKITHVKAFEFAPATIYGAITYGQLSSLTYGQLATTIYGSFTTYAQAAKIPGKNFAFCDSNGNISTVNFDLSEAAADGVLILGKWQYLRKKTLIHQRIDIENVPQGQTFSCYLIPTLDGKTLQAPVLISGAVNIISRGPELLRLGARVSGKTISVLFKGAFNLVSIIMDFTLGGDR